MEENKRKEKWKTSENRRGCRKRRGERERERERERNQETWKWVQKLIDYEGGEDKRIKYKQVQKIQKEKN